MNHTTVALALLATLLIGARTAIAQQPICSENASALERLICVDTTQAAGNAPPGAPPGNPLPPPPPPPERPPPPTTSGTGTLYISLTDHYRANLSTLGIAGVRRRGVDEAYGMLTWNEATGTYEGVLNAVATGSYQAQTALGNCGDVSAGHQSIYAVGHVEPWQGQPSYLAPWRDSVVVGRFGPEAIVFYFFPASQPQFGPTTSGRCQQPIRFEGYGPGANANQAPYPWLPQTRRAGWFLPLNDTRWTTQNGLIVRMPPPHEWVNYWDLTQVLPQQGVVSRWNVTVVHGGF
jgi:hypothetical protein